MLINFKICAESSKLINIQLMPTHRDQTSIFSFFFSRYVPLSLVLFTVTESTEFVMVYSRTWIDDLTTFYISCQLNFVSFNYFKRICSFWTFIFSFILSSVFLSCLIFVCYCRCCRLFYKLSPKLALEPDVLPTKWMKLRLEPFKYFWVDCCMLQ